MKKKTFEEKVKSMSAKQIIMAMVNGLKKEHVQVDMDTFASVKVRKGKKVCFGCAATNAICEISDYKPNVKDFARSNRLGVIIESTTHNFIQDFELALDYLRRGNISYYNGVATDLGIATIEEPDYYTKLPQMTNQNWRKVLPFYEALAKYQDVA